MVIRTNTRANTTHNAIRAADISTRRSSERLSSGFRINSAADDAANLGVSEKKRAQLEGLSMAVRNVRDGISMTQIAEGAMQRVNDILIRVRDLTTQMANDVYSLEDRERILYEIEWLLDEVNQIANNSEFNGIPLLGGRIPEGIFGLAPAAPGSPNVDGPHIDNLNDLLAYIQGSINSTSGVRQPWPGTVGTPIVGGGAYGSRPPVDRSWVENNIPGLTNINITREEANLMNREALWNWFVINDPSRWPPNWSLRPDGLDILANTDLIYYSQIDDFMTNMDSVLTLFERDPSPPGSYWENSFREHFWNPYPSVVQNRPELMVPGATPLDPPVSIEYDRRNHANNENRQTIIDWINDNFSPTGPGGSLVVIGTGVVLGSITLHPDWEDRINATNLYNQTLVGNFQNGVTPPLGQYNINDIFIVDIEVGWEYLMTNLNMSVFERDNLITSSFPFNAQNVHNRFNQIMFANRLGSIPAVSANLVDNYREILADMVTLFTEDSNPFSNPQNFADFLNGVPPFAGLFSSLFNGGTNLNDMRTALGFGIVAGNPAAFNNMIGHGFSPDPTWLAENPEAIAEANRQALVQHIYNSTSPPDNPLPVPWYRIYDTLSDLDGFFNNAHFTTISTWPGFAGGPTPGILQNPSVGTNIYDWVNASGPDAIMPVFGMPNLYDIFGIGTIDDMFDFLNMPGPTPILNDWELINEAHRTYVINWLESQFMPPPPPSHPLHNWSMPSDWYERIAWPAPIPNNQFMTHDQVQNFINNQILVVQNAVRTEPAAPPPPGPGAPLGTGSLAGPWRPIPPALVPNANPIFIYSYPPSYDENAMFATINWQGVEHELHPHHSSYMTTDGPVDAFRINREALINWIVEVLGGPLFRSDYLFDSRLINLQDMFDADLDPFGGYDAIVNWLNSERFDEVFISRHDFYPDPLEKVIQAGANSYEQIHLTFHAMTLPALGISRFPGQLRAAMNLESGEAISRTINANLENMDRAVSRVVMRRSDLGAKMLRMEYAESNLHISSENFHTAHSQIRDTDMAQEAINRLQASVVTEAATMMMTQASVDHLRVAAVLLAAIPSTSNPR